MTLIQLFTSIANAIRAKTGSSSTITASDFPDEISNIPTGTTPTGTISITENGTVDVTNYANAEVNVSGGISGEYALIDYTGITNSNIKYAIRELSDIDLSAQTTCASAFSGFGFLEKIGKVKTSSNTTNMGSMFSSCAKLESIDLSEFNTSNVTTIANMFDFCSLLETINFGQNFKLSKITSNGLRNTFRSCSALSNATLNNILAILATYTNSSNRTLAYIGLSSAQATTCTGLSNWATLSANGWTTGY